MLKRIVVYFRTLLPSRIALPKSTPAFLKNKYLLASVVFCVWVGFIDENSVLERFQFQQDYDKLVRDKEYYQEKISRDAYEMEELDDDGKLELIAREKYLMKKEDEDIFIIQKN